MQFATGTRERAEARYEMAARSAASCAVRAEQDRVAGRQQRVHVVVAGHDVQGVLGHDAGGDLEHEATDLLSDRDVVGLQPVQDALAGGGVGDVVAAGQRRAHRTTLCGVLTFGLHEEGMLAPDVELPFSACGLERLRDLGRRGDRVADHATTHVLHHVGDSAVSVDDLGDTGVGMRLQ